MTISELQTGELRHQEAKLSRKLAMAVSLTKSSSELKLAWETDPSTFLTTLKGAIAAYDENKNVETLLVHTISSLASVIDGEESDVDYVTMRALEIVRGDETDQPS